MTNEEIELLKAENRKLRIALEFYANKETYGSDDTSRTTSNECFDIVCFDFSRNLEPYKDYAGRRAREALYPEPIEEWRRDRRESGE